VGNYPVVISGSKFRIDIAFPDLKVAIEIDGWAFHRSKERRDQDMRKLNLLARTGWTVLTFGWEDIAERGDYFLELVQSVLGSRVAI